MTEKAPLWEPFYPASFSTPCVTSVFRRKPLFRTGHRTRQIWLICEWDLGLAWLANLQKSCLSKHSTKTAKQGLVWEQGGCFLTLPAKAAHRPTQLGQWGDLALPTVDLPGFFFFKSIPKSSFLCLCCAVLYRRLHLSIPLIMFYKTLLGDMETLSFPFAAIGCASSNCLKIGPNRCFYGVWYCFPTSTEKASHKPTQPVTQGVPAWLSYLMLSSSVHPEIFSPSAVGRIAPLLPGSGEW